MDSRILTQNERSSLIEEIMENKNPIYLEDYVQYIMGEGNTNFTIRVDYDKIKPSIFILEYFNENKISSHERKKVITKNDMFYSPYFPCCIFWGIGKLYIGSTNGLEEINKVIIYKNFDKKKTNLVNLISLDNITDHINEDYKIKFDSFIIGYSILSKK